MRDISSIVIRVAHDHAGAADRLIRMLFPRGLCGALIAGEPGSGKTTLLRDLARQLSRGAVRGCYSVVLVDERGELSRGNPGCCVLRGYDKGDGILLAVRSLAPQVILCDEIGSKKDVESILWALNCGVSVVATLHARTRAEALGREAGRRLIESGAFARVAILEGAKRPCAVGEVVTADELASDDLSGGAGGELLGDRRHERRVVLAAGGGA